MYTSSVSSNNTIDNTMEQNLKNIIEHSKNESGTNVEESGMGNYTKTFEDIIREINERYQNISMKGGHISSSESGSESSSESGNSSSSVSVFESGSQNGQYVGDTERMTIASDGMPGMPPMHGMNGMYGMNGMASMGGMNGMGGMGAMPAMPAMHGMNGMSMGGMGMGGMGFHNTMQNPGMMMNGGGMLSSTSSENMSKLADQNEDVTSVGDDELGICD